MLDELDVDELEGDGLYELDELDELDVDELDVDGLDELDES